jgi:uncharacterized protein YoxC
MSTAFKRLQSQQPNAQEVKVETGRIEVIKKLNDKIECFQFENGQNLKKVQETIEEAHKYNSEHEKILKGHADETEDLRERCAELEKLVNSHVEDMKNFRDEIYNIVEEYLVNQTPRLQNNVDEGQKKLISELINRIDDLDKKVEDLQPKIHLTNAKSEKVEKLRMDRLKSAP